ncbi:MAG: pilus assembly protein [Legionella sp.]|nr:MAG: pilus assembly protein [Legionella sp.]
MKERGFALIELVITLFLFVLITILSASSSSELYQKNEALRLRDELKAAMHYAKLQALNRGNKVLLEALSTDRNWAKGMVLKSGNIILYQWQWNHPSWQLRWTGIHGEQQIQLSSHPLQAMSNGRFILSRKNGREEWVLVLNKLGRLRESP